MIWTDERVELLRKLWAEGLSASQIAAQLGGVSRNAVIGKVHRLKLSGRGRTTSAPARQKKPAQPATAKAASRPMSSGRSAPSSMGATALQAQFDAEPQARIIERSNRVRSSCRSRATCNSSSLMSALANGLSAIRSQRISTSAAMIARKPDPTAVTMHASPSSPRRNAVASGKRPSEFPNSPAPTVSAALVIAGAVFL